MRPSITTAPLLLACSCAGTAPASARVHAADAPAPVAARVLELLGADATIEAEGPAERRTYEAETHTKLAIELDATGALLATEVALPPATLPAAVAATASALGRITEAELVVTATGVAFEVEVTGPAGSVELLIDAAGAVVGDQPDDEEDHDDDDDGDHD